MRFDFFYFTSSTIKEAFNVPGLEFVALRLITSFFPVYAVFKTVASEMALILSSQAKIVSPILTSSMFYLSSRITGA